MANRRKEIPSFVSIEVGVARSIAEAMTDDEWGKWSKKALDDLSIGCTRKDTDARVRNLYEKAKDNMDKEYIRKKEWYENRKAQGNQLTNQLTADGDTREDSLNMTTVRKDDELESGTSANLYGDASHLEAEDESATVSKNMRRVPQNEAPEHGFSGGRAAQGTMSRPPEAAAQSGKPYDQETALGNYQRRAGGMLPSSSLKPPARSGAVDVLNLAYAGEFGNVRLTQEQYAQLGIKFGNQLKLNRAIDSLSCQIENGEKNPQNHYAELVKWANYRDDMDERKIQQSEAPKMTEMEKSWIREAEKIARYEKELAANERR